jgi:hypothetical protein
LGVSLLIFAFLGLLEPRLVRAVRNARRTDEAVNRALQAFLTAPEPPEPIQLVQEVVWPHVRDLGITWQGDGGNEDETAGNLVFKRDSPPVSWAVQWGRDFIEQVVTSEAVEVGRSRLHFGSGQATAVAVARECAALDRKLTDHLGI